MNQKHLQGMTDQELLENIAQKDPSSFKALYDRYSDTLNGWAYSRIKDREATADLMQEFWASLWLNPQNMRPDEEGSVRRFLLQNVSFRILKYFHKQSVSVEIANDEIVAGQIQSLSYNHVQEEMDEKEIRRLIDGVLETLPVLQRRIYELRCMEQRSVKETASILEISESTVRNGLSAARSVLREKVVNYQAGTSGGVNMALIWLLFLLDK